MNKPLISSAIILSAALLVGCSDDDDNELTNQDQVTVQVDFSQDTGWQAGFADYPDGEEEDWELEAEPMAEFELAAGGMTAGFRLHSDNHSDDTLMFLKGKVEGLTPGDWYNVTFDVGLASNVSHELCSGVGGSPAALTVKLGATTIEPDTYVEETGTHPYRLINIDTGAQTQRGYDVMSMGNIGIEGFENCDTAYELFAIKRFDSTDRKFRVQADATGSAWLLFATDSGFEGKSTIYFTDALVEFNKVKADELKEITINFTTNDEYFESLAYDYPAGREFEWEIQAGAGEFYRNTDNELKTGYIMHFYNRSDDTALFALTPLQGLKPNTHYEALFDLHFATNVTQGCFGIGGSPDAVAVKAGVSGIKPAVSVPEGETHYRINLDFGQQLNGGTDATLLSKIGSAELDSCDPNSNVYKLRKADDYEQQSLMFLSDDKGMAWIYMGMESGFEGPTTIFLDNATVSITEL